MSEEFCEYIDELINQIDKRQNNFNADDMRFIAFKGKQQTLKDELEFLKKIKMKCDFSFCEVMDKIQKRIKQIEKELEVGK